jgi:predicted PurR-regulated permease PerM|uniref:ATP synthase protein MI25 n=1 Tax=Chlorella vulgaris TaxID=3077 RepID=A0A650ANX3_CHLVU|nr:ATP synthase F0 subunit beta [Chlorella vulgaris]QGN75013.1 ATP synthase F0 subunit beta [Chlorella vulgaris]QGN75129.1 ATP synthase F0 subunit beta [Chlorella vulgaris]UNZ99613.1 Atp4 [Chlorella vulgaris]USG56571.1 ATP synthase F0 subunit beta [Chlorella vulgaris]
MFNNEKLRLYLFLFLAFSVCSSKNILIYNEETLVALSFFCFLFFVLHYFGNTIKDSLNERSQVIREELQNFLILKENSFQELLNQHQKVSGLLKAMQVLNEFTKSELNVLNKNGKKALKNMFTSRIDHKLKTLVFSKLMIQQKLQSLLSEKIISNVLVAFTKKGKGSTKLATFQNKAIKKAMDSLLTNAQRNQ